MIRRQLELAQHDALKMEKFQDDLASFAKSLFKLNPDLEKVYGPTLGQSDIDVEVSNAEKMKCDGYDTLEVIYFAEKGQSKLHKEFAKVKTLKTRDLKKFMRKVAARHLELWNKVGDKIKAVGYELHYETETQEELDDAVSMMQETGKAEPYRFIRKALEDVSIMENLHNKRQRVV